MRPPFVANTRELCHFCGRLYLGYRMWRHVEGAHPDEVFKLRQADEGAVIDWLRKLCLAKQAASRAAARAATSGGRKADRCKLYELD